MSLKLIGAAAVVLAIACVGASSAQNWQLSPNSGTVTLRTGFTPDPTNVQLQAGGSIDVSRQHSGCAGFVADAPDVDLQFTNGSNLPLIISVNSNADTTLAINGPDGRWYCDDDSGEGNNPSVAFAHPQSGLYDIYVGTYTSGSYQPAVLSISEEGSN